MTLLSTVGKADYSKTLELGDLTIKLKPIEYREMNAASVAQFEIQKLFLQLETLEDADEKLEKSKKAIEEVTLLTMDIIGSSIEFIKTPNAIVTEREFIVDFLKHCDKNIYNAIKDFNTELKQKSELKPIDITCSACEHKYQQPFTLDASNFFG